MYAKPKNKKKTFKNIKRFTKIKGSFSLVASFLCGDSLFAARKWLLNALEDYFDLLI